MATGEVTTNDSELLKDLLTTLDRKSSSKHDAEYEDFEAAVRLAERMHAGVERLEFALTRIADACSDDDSAAWYLSDMARSALKEHTRGH